MVCLRRRGQRDGGKEEEEERRPYRKRKEEQDDAGREWNYKMSVLTGEQHCVLGCAGGHSAVKAADFLGGGSRRAAPQNCLDGTFFPLCVFLPREPFSGVRCYSWIAGMGVRGGFG